MPTVLLDHEHRLLMVTVLPTVLQLLFCDLLDELSMPLWSNISRLATPGKIHH